MMIQNSLQVVSEKVIETTEIESATNWWMWIAIAEFVIIVLLILKDKTKHKDSNMQKFKKESLEKEIDFDNIINSSFNSKTLYDALKVKCHPDRFPIDKEQNEIAEKIFQEITKNKNNVKRLNELKEEAIQKLGIKF